MPIISVLPASTTLRSPSRRHNARSCAAPRSPPCSDAYVSSTNPSTRPDSPATRSPYAAKSSPHKARLCLAPNRFSPSTLPSEIITPSDAPVPCIEFTACLLCKGIGPVLLQQPIQRPSLSWSISAMRCRSSSSSFVSLTRRHSYIMTDDLRQLMDKGRRCEWTKNVCAPASLLSSGASPSVVPLRITWLLTPVGPSFRRAVIGHEYDDHVVCKLHIVEGVKGAVPCCHRCSNHARKRAIVSFTL